MAYPSSIDSFSNPQGTTLVATDDHAQQHRIEGSAVVAIETKVGLAAGTPTQYAALYGSGNGTSLWGTTGTIALGSVVVPGTVTALGFSAAVAPGIGSVADAAGGTLTVNAQQGQVYYSVMGTAAGNRTIGTPLNPTGYQNLTYAFKASGSANGTIVWSSAFRGTANASALGTGLSWNYYGWRYNAIDSKWDFMGQSLTVI